MCPNGKIALRITSLGSILESHRVSPIFPLLFHNEFNFKKTFTRLAALTELQRILEKEPFYAELIQWLNPCNQPIILATFHTNLADLLYPVAQCKHLLPGVDIDLLMDPTKYFPVSIFFFISSFVQVQLNIIFLILFMQGIIAPKIEISTKTIIEVKTIYATNLDQSCVFNTKTIDSKVKYYKYYFNIYFYYLMRQSIINRLIQQM